MRHLLFPVVAIAFGSLIACSAASTDDADTSGADLTGSLTNALSCAAKDAYEKADLTDIAPVATKDLPSTIQSKLSGPSVANGSLKIAGGRTVFVIDYASGMDVFDDGGNLIAHADTQQNVLAWTDASKKALSCNGAAPVLSNPVTDAGAPEPTSANACLAAGAIDATQFAYAGSVAPQKACTAAEAKALVDALETDPNVQTSVAKWEAAAHLSAGCTACAFQDYAAATANAPLGAMLMQDDQLVATNDGACPQVVSNSVDCGRAYFQASECALAACQTCTTNEDYIACSQDPNVWAVDCNAAVNAAVTACGGSDKFTSIQTKCQGGGAWKYTFEAPLHALCVGDVAP